MRRSLAIATCLVLLTCAARTGVAQNRAVRAMLETLRTEATITDMRPNLLQVTAEDGKQWWVTPPNDVERIVFRGTADTSFLQPRMTVRFHAQFRPTERPRKEYHATQPVATLELITIRPGSEPGLFPESADAAAPQLFEQQEPPAKKPAKDDKPPATEDLACLVIGTLLEYKNDKIRVSAGPVLVVAELPATAEVSVDVRHFGWARAGDKMELVARYLPSLPGRAEGDQFTITAAQPLTGDEKSNKQRRRAGRERANK